MNLFHRHKWSQWELTQTRVVQSFGGKLVEGVDEGQQRRCELCGKFQREEFA